MSMRSINLANNLRWPSRLNSGLRTTTILILKKTCCREELRLSVARPNRMLGLRQHPVDCEETVGNGLHSILFYPDGTSQNARIVLQNDKGNQLQVELRGLTGIAKTTRVQEGGAMNQTTRTLQKRRKGLSLLEVILSIAILGGAMTVIGYIYFIGYRSAVQVRIRSEANILADSVMAELAAGVIDASSSGDVPIQGSPGWTYSVAVEQSLQPGLLMATVQVQNTQQSNRFATGVSIVRFVPDPDYEPEEDEG